jgi:hypothetical protein
LRERPLPLADHRQELKQEDPQLRIVRLGPHFILQIRERPIYVPVA